MKRLIVNADDFGHSRAVNVGVVEAFEGGILTSASLMVQREGAEEAAALARSRPPLGIGLHVELGEWSYRDREGWVPLYEVAEDNVEAEVAAQLERFRALLGNDPTHLDSHQHVHLREPARSVLRRMADRLGVPLRHYDTAIRYCGNFYGQTGTGDPLPDLIGVEALTRLLASLPAGITELGCHPARGAVAGTSYSSERERELGTLCDPRVRAAVDRRGIQLHSFATARETTWPA